MANLNTKTIASGVGDILACDGGIPTGSTATQVKSGDGDVSPLYLTDGEIGIGTANPTAQLHLVGSGTDGQLIIENTDAGSDSAPDLRLYRNSASPANDDSVGKIEFYGKDDGGNLTQYAYIHCSTPNVANGAEGGQLEFIVSKSGTLTEALTISHEGNVGINTGHANGQPESQLTVRGDAFFHQDGQTYDGDPKAIGLFIRTNKTGTGTAPNGGTFSDHPNLDFRRWVGGDGVTIHKNATISCSPENQGGLVFYVSEESTNVQSTTERMRIDTVGRVAIGHHTPSAQLHVDQASASGARPVLKLDQADVDDTFIDFVGTTASDSSKSISTSTATASAKFGAVAIEINGVKKWIRVYDTAV